MAASIRIRFRRTGGLAGLTMGTDTDTDQLPADYRGLVRGLLTESPPRTPSDAPAKPDRFTYDLHIDDGDRARSVRWQETTVPENMRALIAELTRRSRPVPWPDEGRP
jgi:Emfourin